MQPIFRQGSILLTGATGFLGGQLLQELLAQRAEPIICLIRGEGSEQVAQRGRALSADPRVSFVHADLEAPGLGLDEALRGQLAWATQEIFHCAASVTFDLPLAQAQRINVDGTRALLELAGLAQLRGGFKRLHHVSTAYVAARTFRRASANDLPGDHPSNYRNTYERSKARAERLLREQRQVPVTIYRPSIVAGDTKTGATSSWNVLYMPMRMIHRGQLPFLRKDGPGRLDCVGVDYVARGMLALAEHVEQQSGRAGKAPQLAAFHLTAGAAHFTIDSFVAYSVAAVDRARASGSAGKATDAARCRVVGPWSWSLMRVAANLARQLPRRYRRARLWGVRATRAFAAFAPYEPYTEVRSVFDNAREQALLAPQGIAMPPPEAYLQTIAEYAVRANFGGRRSPVARSESTACDDDTLVRALAL